MVYGTILTYSEEAALKKTKEIARNLKKMGLSREQIAQATQSDPTEADFPEMEERLLKEEAELRAKARFTRNLIKMGLSREQILRATQLDLTGADFPETEERLLTEEAALKAEKRKAIHIAQNLIKKGWASAEIAETTGLDLPTVESLTVACDYS